MVDWREAGRKADAHRIRNLYRAGFGLAPKGIARGRIVEALKAAGGTTVIDLWGGGLSAKAFVAAGFRVISVDDGRTKIIDNGKPVSTARKRRALEHTAAEDGYEWRWGDVSEFAHEADVAFLDLCGPPSAEQRRAVEACRHMKAVVVTLVVAHDALTGGLDSHEREMVYQLLLKMEWAERPRWKYMATGGSVRRLTDYRSGGNQSVFVFLLSNVGHIAIPPMKATDRQRQRPDMHQRHLAVKRSWYYASGRSDLMRRRTQELRAERLEADPAFKAKTERLALLREQVDDPTARARAAERHGRHLRRGTIPRKPCPLCAAERPTE